MPNVKNRFNKNLPGAKTRSRTAHWCDVYKTCTDGAGFRRRCRHTSMPSVDREDEAAVLRTVKRYFYAGFAFLPWLWLFNFLYVLPVLKRGDSSAARSIRHYAFASLAFSFVFFIGLTTWFTWFLVNRVSLGPLGDQLRCGVLGIVF